jgi:ABC-type uncharacterized transport system permease subunit
MQMTSFRGALWGLVAIGVLITIVAALTGLLVIVAVVVSLAVLNLVYLPRAARWMGLRAGWLALILLPLTLAVGFIATGFNGAAWAAGLWLVAIGAPRLAGHEMSRRIRRRIGARTTTVYYDVTRPTVRPGGRPLPPADGPGQGEYGL